MQGLNTEGTDIKRGSDQLQRLSSQIIKSAGNDVNERKRKSYRCIMEEDSEKKNDSDIVPSGSRLQMPIIKPGLELRDINPPPYESCVPSSIHLEGTSGNHLFDTCTTPCHAFDNTNERSLLQKVRTMEVATEDMKRKKGTRRGSLNATAKSVLKAWMFSPEHFSHPYPSEEEKEVLAAEAGIDLKQLSNWFTNARKRLWQPVLRKTGVEVKNFLSTGRGGVRGGSKLHEMPLNLHLLLPSGYCSLPDVQPNIGSGPKRPLARHHSSPKCAKRAFTKDSFMEQEIRAAESLLGLNAMTAPSVR